MKQIFQKFDVIKATLVPKRIFGSLDWKNECDPFWVLPF